MEIKKYYLPIKNNVSVNNLKIEKNIKHNINEYDFSVLRYDNMFAPIMLNDEFFGFTEIYREKAFSTEDATADTPEPGKLIFDVEQKIYTMFGLPAFLHSSKIFKGIILAFY